MIGSRSEHRDCWSAAPILKRSGFVSISSISFVIAFAPLKTVRPSPFGIARATTLVGELWMKRKKLGEILIDQGRITPATLQKLFKEQEGNMVRLGELILERGIVDKG